MSISAAPAYDASLFADYSKAYNPYSTPVPFSASSTSRISCTLYIENLPNQTRPQHLGKIFAEPYPKGGKRGRERDAGITMIEIYTIPRVESQSALSPSENRTKTESTMTIKSNNNKWSLSSSLKRAINKSPSTSTPAVTASTQLRSVRSNSFDSSSSSSSSSSLAPRPTPTQEATPIPTAVNTSSTAGESTVHVQGVEDDEVQQQDEQEESGDRTSVDMLDDEDKITIAYVHFESDDHLQRAKDTLSEITIGGREITHETVGQTRSQRRQRTAAACDNTQVRADDIARVNVNVNANVGKRMWAWWTRENQISHELTV